MHRSLSFFPISLSISLATCLSILLALGGCSDDPGAGDTGGGGTDGGGGGDGGGMDGSTTDGGGMDGSATDGGGTDAEVVIITEDGGTTWSCVVTACDGHLLECGNCMDEDGDGLVDSHDPECLGPCDNTEGDVLLAGVGGETGGPCKSDCYFDFGNGSGNDDCDWDHRCDPLSIGPDYHPEGASCEYDPGRVDGRTCPAEQSATCLDVCRPLTPNGCDCFGCCTFDAIAGRADADGGEHVWLGSVLDGTNDGTCTLADVTDTSACRPCTPVADCSNDCGRCELCVGRDTLPPECLPGPGPDAGPGPDGSVPDSGTIWDGGVPPPRCDPGVQVCGLSGDSPCADLYYCVTGCCVPTII